MIPLFHHSDTKEMLRFSRLLLNFKYDYLSIKAGLSVDHFGFLHQIVHTKKEKTSRLLAHHVSPCFLRCFFYVKLICSLFDLKRETTKENTVFLSSDYCFFQV